MRDYSLYVWAAYGISFVSTAAAVAMTWLGLARARAALEKLK